MFNKKYNNRIWAVKNARLLYIFYNNFIKLLRATKLLWKYIPLTTIESTVKGVMFDCKMCGNCILSSTGMSCPMNCPKSLRNGPCGGVRADGGCEVIPDMPCVWVLAWEGNKSINEDTSMTNLQPALEYTLQGTSSWIREINKS
jgi:hypothetical protein|tara:strand:+ start:1694 stop:2125 length:432 start_codon:yes stop_codon:yes gene_type:complete